MYNYKLTKKRVNQLRPPCYFMHDKELYLYPVAFDLNTNLSFLNTRARSRLVTALNIRNMSLVYFKETRKVKLLHGAGRTLTISKARKYICNDSQ